MNETLLNFLLSIALSVIGMMLGFVFGKLKERHTCVAAEDLAIRNGIQALLRRNIIKICDTCLEQGYVKLHDLESLDDLYEHYKALGGNGTVVKLMTDVKELELKKDR